jgi:hypothetical protein
MMKPHNYKVMMRQAGGRFDVPASGAAGRKVGTTENAL